MRKMFDPIKRKIALMVSRAIINLIDDANEIQMAQVSMLDGEIQDDAEVFGQFGFASNPPNGSEAIVVSVGGVRSHGVILGISDRQYRIKNLGKGFAAIYDQFGNQIILGDEKMTFTAVTKIEVNAPETDWLGNINLTGNLDASGDVKAGAISLKNHKHGNVQSGGAKTGISE